MRKHMTGGDAMVQAVLRHGVNTVFGLPGVQTYPIIDALQRAGNQVRFVSSRHEQGSGYMAYGYAKASARPGVYTVVPGPGVLNTGGALCTAVAGSSRCCLHRVCPLPASSSSSCPCAVAASN